MSDEPVPSFTRIFLIVWKTFWAILLVLVIVGIIAFLFALLTKINPLF